MLARLLASLPRWLAPLMLVLIAGHQLWLVKQAHLSPWLGGGFGMFASTDGPSRRYLHVRVSNADAHKALPIPADLHDAASRAAALPSRRALASLAAELARREMEGPLRWSEVTIQVWVTRYDKETLVPARQLLKAERFDLARL